MHPYIGGKSIISKWIFENMPKKKWKRYAEIFGGAMWTYIKRDIRANEVIYNDYNPFLYNLWKCMTTDRAKLLDNLSNIKLNDKPTFHKNKKIVKDIESNQKDDFVKSIPNYDMASIYVYLLTHCFSGDISGGMKLYENAWGPFIKKLTDNYYINKLEAITAVENIDCEDLIEKYDGEGVFLYADPPYFGKEHLYGFHNFTKEKHYSFADKLKSCNAMWILSYYDYSDLEDLYPVKDYIWLKKEYTRSSSSVKDKGAKGVEVLVYPNELEEMKNERINLFFK